MPLAAPDAPGFDRALLIRRPLDAPDDPKQLAYYLTCAPAGTPTEALVAVAGRRWTVEEALEAAKGEVGLDHYAVRRWDGWYRHITLARFALAYLPEITTPGAARWGKLLSYGLPLLFVLLRGVLLLQQFGAIQAIAPR